MLKLRGILAVIIFGLFLSALASSLALAADAKPMTFGSVDVEKAFNGYEKKAQLEQQLAGEVAQAEQWFQLRNSHKLLTPEEFKELTDLKAKAGPAETDKKRIEDILALSKQRDEAFQALQQKSNLTDAEKTQLASLQVQVKQCDSSIAEEQGKRVEELGKKRVELSKQVMQEVEAAVAAVAKEKGLAMVFAKSVGEYTFVVYSNVDITDEVLKRLNKK